MSRQPRHSVTAGLHLGELSRLRSKKSSRCPPKTKKEVRPTTVDSRAVTTKGHCHWYSDQNGATGRQKLPTILHCLTMCCRQTLLLTIYGLFWANLATADRVLIIKRPLLPSPPILLKNLRLEGIDDNFLPLPRRGTSSQSTTSVPKRLLEPFAQVLQSCSSEKNHQRDIETDKLLKACRKLKEAMATVGQDRNAAELGRNLKKIESLHRAAPPGRRETLRALLEYEKELGVHGPNGQLKDPSGAMGLLWIRRSLAFQERLYSNILEKSMPAREAALQAYHETLEPYHGWALQQVYSFALKNTTPSRHEMFQKLCAVPPSSFGVSEEEQTAQDLRKLCETWKPVSSVASSGKRFDLMDPPFSHCNIYALPTALAYMGRDL